MKEKNNKRVRKGLLPAIAMVALSFVASAGATYAWWNILKAEVPGETNVGNRLTALTAVQKEMVVEGELIPVGEKTIGNQVNEIVFEYEIEIADLGEGDTAPTKMEIRTENFKVGGVEDYNKYFVLDLEGTNVRTENYYEEGIKEGKYEYEVVLTIVMTEAEGLIDADNIKNKEITFTMVFELIQQPYEKGK